MPSPLAQTTNPLPRPVPLPIRLSPQTSACLGSTGLVDFCSFSSTWIFGWGEPLLVAGFNCTSACSRCSDMGSMALGGGAPACVGLAPKNGDFGSNLNQCIGFMLKTTPKVAFSSVHVRASLSSSPQKYHSPKTSGVK